MTSIIEVINDGWEINIKTTTKRMGELNNRHWENRVIWTAMKDEYKLKSEWEGFIKPEDAINDICSKISEII